SSSERGEMTWYTFFKSAHVVAAAVWIGGAAMIQALAFRIVRTGDARRQAEFAKDTEVVGMRVFIPATWVLLLAGIAMMINFDWSWGQNWIVLGLIAFALSFAVGAGFLGPEGGRIAAIIEREGPASPEALARIHRILLISRCELVVLATVLVNMVVKPSGNAGWFWGMLIAMLAGIAAVLLTYRASRRETTPVAQPLP
ncbi:MAG: DUF2269 family protein, partial [Gaiellaceae bacterium]